MLRLITAAVLALCLPLAASAQDNFKGGSFWAISSIATKPTRFDDYVGDISGLWRSQMEALKKDGKVLSYMMLSNVHPRDGEPDLWLMVEWASAAAMLDTPWEYYEDLMEEMGEDEDDVEEAARDREELRTLMSDVLAREITFKDDD
jgi:hypothetical protein